MKCNECIRKHVPLKGKLPVYQSSAYSVTVSTQEIGATYYPAGRDDQAIQGGDTRTHIRV